MVVLDILTGLAVLVFVLPLALMTWLVLFLLAYTSYQAWKDSKGLW